VEEDAEKSLERFRFDKHIIKLIVQQLKKDIELSGGYADFVNIETDLFELNRQLADYLQLLRKSNSNLFYSLLYRIDIPDTLLPQDTAEASRIILKRILVKILLRMKYS
jgi:hypothetical protein